MKRSLPERLFQGPHTLPVHHVAWCEAVLSQKSPEWISEHVRNEIVDRVGDLGRVSR